MEENKTGTPQTPETQTPEPVVIVANGGQEEKQSKKFQLPKVKLPKLNTGNLYSNRKKIVIALVVILLLLLILSAIPTLLKLGKGTPTQSPPPSETASPTPTQASNPSQYANDPDVARIEERINSYESKLNQSQFREDNLRVPNLDWDVSFE